jgi:twinkle protein
MAKREGVKVFMLDNLMALDYTERGELNERQSRLVKRLKAFARKFNAIVHLVAHPRKPAFGQHRMTKYDVSGTGNITDLADRVFGFHRLTKDELAKIELGYEGFNNVLMIFKDRKYGVVDEEVKFKFDFYSKRYYTTPKEKEREYNWVKNIEDKPIISAPWMQMSTDDPF